MSEDLHHFDDPALKAALKRAMPPVGAPETLRNRVLELFDENAAGEPRPIRLVPELKPAGQRSVFAWMATGRRMAIAASILGLGLGVGLFFAMEENGTAPDSAPIAHNSSVMTPASSLVDVAHREVMQGLSTGRNMLAPYDQVSKDAHVSPLNVDLSALGWHLVGARKLSDTEDLPIQLFYERDSRSLSVFLLRPSADGQTPIATLGDHQIATRQRHGVVLCVLADGFAPKAEAQEINRVADYLQKR